MNMHEGAPVPQSLTFVLGLPGAGKSTAVQDFLELRMADNYTAIHFDMLRLAMGHVFCRATEPQVNALGCIMARVAFMEGRDVIIDESITTPGLAMDLVGIAREFGARVRMIHIGTPEETCRANRVPQRISGTEFDRKVAEWAAHGAFILGLADEVVHLEPKHIPEEPAAPPTPAASAL